MEGSWHQTGGSMSVTSPITTVYPNGQVLVSTAFTPAQLNVLMQSLTCGMLGINPVDPSLVRIDWQTEGQPFENVNYDVCYLACNPVDVEYSRIREMQLATPASGPGVVESWLYTKGWRFRWVLYGPSAEDRARQIKSAFFMDYFNEQLNLNQIFPLNNPPEVTRVPEKINGQWFERADFYIDVYEQVNESITDGVVTNVEVIVEESTHGQVADITVTTE